MTDYRTLQSELSNLLARLNQKDCDYVALNQNFNKLKEDFLNLEKEYADLKEKYARISLAEKNIKALNEKIVEKDDLIDKLKEKLYMKEKQAEEDIRNLEHKYDKELNLYKAMYENCMHKIEIANSVLKVNEIQHEKILELENLLKEYAENESIRSQQKDVKHETRLTDLKKKMMDHIKQTQKNSSQLNIQSLDINSKLTLLQNHQLLIELEYQSTQIEDLIRKKEELEKKNLELEGVINIHKKVENALTEKNTLFCHTIRKMAQEARNDNPHEKFSYTSQGFILKNTSKSITQFSDSSNLIHTMPSLEITSDPLDNPSQTKLKHLQQLEKKFQEYQILKCNYDKLSDKLKNYETKALNLLNLLENAIEKLQEDEEFKSKKELYVDIDSLEQLDFSNLNSEQKYSLLMILIKYLLPVINLKNIESDLIRNGYVENVQIKFDKKKEDLVGITVQKKAKDYFPKIRAKADKKNIKLSGNRPFYVMKFE